MKKILLIVLSAAVLVFASAFFTAFYLNMPPVSTAAQKTVKVDKGMTAKTVIRKLKDEGLIRSERYAYIYARLKKINLKSGSYQINSEMTTAEILHKLTEGTQGLKKITVPEGLTLQKTARLFKTAGIADAADFEKLVTDKEFLNANGIKADTAEGFLYPDTYFFGEEDSLEMMLELMIKTFFEKTAAIPNFPKDFNELYKKLILASIIEREYQLAEEAPVIASVFSNRLKVNMGMESCATVEYIITEIKHKKHPTRLFYDDLKIQSPYNTYMHAGLPPGPISNPGFTALYAACNPAETDYFYFRLIDADTGKHTFSKTLGEHNKAGEVLLLKKAAGQ